MDCVRTAVRQGATSVKCLYRRDRENMPGSRRAVAHAEEEGVEFVWLSAPEAFNGDDIVRGVHAQRMRTSVQDATCRQTPPPHEDSGSTTHAQPRTNARGLGPAAQPTPLPQEATPVRPW